MTGPPTIITLPSSTTVASAASSPAAPPIPTAIITSTITATVTTSPAKTTSPAVTTHGAASSAKTVRSGDTHDVDGLAPSVLAGIHRELNPLALPEGPEAVGLDLRLVDEEIVAASVWSYESEPLLAAEPLHRPRGSLGLRHRIGLAPKLLEAKTSPKPSPF